MGYVSTPGKADHGAIQGFHPLMTKLGLSGSTRKEIPSIGYMEVPAQKRFELCG
jgi:hypothetical protein